MDPLLKSSIVVPTYDRSAYLVRCLEALAALNTDPTTFEVIIVDNNSQDKTRDAYLNSALDNTAIRIRYLLETNQGVSFARNRAITESTGGIVCFLDDDAFPDPEWLNHLLEVFNNPRVGCAGGPCIPDFQGEKVPEWLFGDLQGLVGGYGLSYTKPTRLTAWYQYPLACNMAIRRSVIANVGSFRTDLDRTGHKPLAAGDTEMADRIFKAGWKVMYVPAATVRHLISPTRLKKEYVYRIGRGLAASHIILTHDSRFHIVARWFVSDLWYASRMFFCLIVAFFWMKRLWFDDYMRFWMVAMRLPMRAKALLYGVHAAEFMGQ
jgi:glucosyl-dolichyl phosphate glucuronosyltransferase